MKSITYLLTLFLGLLASTSAMDKKESPIQGSFLPVKQEMIIPIQEDSRLEPELDSYRSLSPDEEAVIEELRKDYYALPSVFKLIVKCDNTTVRSQFPIQITFETDFKGLKPIIVDWTNADFPQNPQRSGHEKLRLPPSWSNPAKTYMKYTEKGWESIEWQNLFDGYSLTLEDFDRKATTSEYNFPLLLYYSADKSASVDTRIRFRTREGAFRVYPLIPVLLKRELPNDIRRYRVDLTTAKWTQEMKKADF